MAGQFDAEALSTLDQTEEVEIETTAADGRHHRTIIWVVVADGVVYIRSVRGAAGRWYREIVAHPDAALHADSLRLAVRASPATDPASIAAASEAYRRKYNTRWPRETASMLRDETLGTTLRLEPA